MITKTQLRKAEVDARKSERARQKHSKFIQRTLSIYRNQQARLRKDSGQDDALLPYSLEDFRTWFQAGLDRGCAYTGERLTIGSASVDHRTPLKRGGSWDLHNLAVCTASVNFLKGELTEDEVRDLLQFMTARYQGMVVADLRRRLSAGGKMLRMRF